MGPNGQNMRADLLSSGLLLTLTQPSYDYARVLETGRQALNKPQM